MIAIFGLDNIWSTISLSLQIYTFLSSLLLLFIEWKEKLLEKILISLFLGENLLLKEIKEGKTPLSLLLVNSLIFSHYFGVNFLSDK